MRGTTCLFACLLFGASLAAPTFTTAQRAAPTACSGVTNVVRVSEIQPGKVETFLSAVTAQRAWYKQAGTADEIVLLRVVDTKTGSFSETEALTFHKVSGAKAPAGDAAYDAFVALYKQSSTIKSQWITCETK
jgi:hypothetical protein